MEHASKSKSKSTLTSTLKRKIVPNTVQGLVVNKKSQITIPPEL